VTLEEAQAAVAYLIHRPTTAPLDQPDRVYLTEPTGESSVPDQMVSFVYLPRAGLTASAESGIGALLTQIPGDTNVDHLYKGIGPSATLEVVTVNGAPAYWIEGPSHFFGYVDPRGTNQVQDLRLASNVLLWEQDGLTFRLEASLTQEEAIAVAESVRPVE
jgi:hypothetical protein